MWRLKSHDQFTDQWESKMFYTCSLLKLATLGEVCSEIRHLRFTPFNGNTCKSQLYLIEIILPGENCPARHHKSGISRTARFVSCSGAKDFEACAFLIPAEFNETMLSHEFSLCPVWESDIKRKVVKITLEPITWLWADVGPMRRNSRLSFALDYIELIFES